MVNYSYLFLPYLYICACICQTFEFQLSHLNLTAAGQQTIVTLTGAEFNSPPGTPLLPQVGKFINLPENSIATGVQILAVEFETLPGRHELPIAQPPIPLSLPPVSSVALNPQFTNLTTFYPETICRISGQGNLRNRRVLTLLFSPVQYQPATHRIRLATRIKIAINLKKQPAGYQPYKDTGKINYLIVTTQYLDTTFQELARWRTLTGHPAQIRHIEWIVNTYPGRDAAEKLRTYLKYCAGDSGLTYLVLGGDADLLPVRKAFAFACGARIHPREDSLPCDLYFSALDGTWDNNHNGVYGEPEDSVDLFPDIFVGRIPVRTPQQARNFINKILSYERNLINDYQLRALFSASVLWTEPWTDEMVAKEIIRQKMPSRFQFSTLYESQQPVTLDTALALLNSGFGIFNHCGHGWIDALALSRQTVLHNPIIAQLTNGRRLGIAYSIGCWTAAFDFDCIGEQFLLNPNGGAVAYIGNSSYGWGAPGNPGFGYSDAFDARFFEQLFSSADPRLGEILARTKTDFIPFSFQPNVYRWHQFGLNLLGDPAMPVQTDTLSPLYIDKPLRIPVGNSINRFVVFDNRGTVNQATFTIITPDSTRTTTLTAPDGTATLQTSCTIPGTGYLTVTAPNHRPLTDSIPVGSGQMLTLVNYRLIDSTGDANGYISAGETFTITFYLKNLSSTPLYSLRLRLSTSSPFFTIEQDQGFLPVLPPETIIPFRCFLIRTRTTVHNGDYGICTLTISDSTQAFSRFPISIQFSEPVLKVVSYSITFQKNTTDTCSLFLKITNSGLAPASSLTGTIFNPDLSQNLELITPGLIFPPIAPGETVWSLVPSFFTSYHDSVRLGVNLVTGRFLFSDTLTLCLKKTGLSNNFDSGLENWSLSGVNGSWYLTAERFHSSPFSIHPGNPDNFYPPNCTCLLVSPKFVVPNKAILSFYCSSELPIYGTDGLYCIISTAHQEETLDFIGAGGALGKNSPVKLAHRATDKRSRYCTGLDLVTEQYWVKYNYDLSFLNPGESAQVKFVFISDALPETVPGFYLDDISIQTADSVFIPGPKTTRILGNFPNPFQSRTTIFLALAAPGWVNLAIYNSTGSKIRTLLSENKPAGYYSIPWDGTAQTGIPVLPGTYFLRLNADNLPPARIQRKIIKIRR